MHTCSCHRTHCLQNRDFPTFLFDPFKVLCSCDVFSFRLNYSWHNNACFLLSALKSPAPSLPSTTDGEWENTSFSGSWVEGRTAGGSRNFLSHRQNPCFPFTVCDESAVTSGVNVRITLRQSRPDTDLHPIGFHIYKVSQTWQEIYQSVFRVMGRFPLFTFPSLTYDIVTTVYNHSRSLKCWLFLSVFTLTLKC